MGAATVDSLQTQIRRDAKKNYFGYLIHQV